MISCRIDSINLQKAMSKADPIKRAVLMSYSLAAIRDTNQYVPYREGRLRQSANSESVPEQGRIIYGSAAVPYARPQYYGYPNKTWPGTTEKWFDVSSQRNKTKWEREAQQAADKVAKS